MQVLNVYQWVIFANSRDSLASPVRISLSHGAGTARAAGGDSAGAAAGGGADGGTRDDAGRGGAGRGEPEDGLTGGQRRADGGREPGGAGAPRRRSAELPAQHDREQPAPGRPPVVHDRP